MPELRWGKNKITIDDFPPEAVKRYGEKKCRRIGLMSLRGGGKDSYWRIYTPPEFREVLITMARSVK